jgi:hypothetical protein
MTTTIRKNSTKKEIRNSLEKFNHNKSRGLRKHFGNSETTTDAVAFQKKIRNEWH